MADDRFELYDLRVEVVAPAGARIHVQAKVGDSFELRGEMLHSAAGAGLLDLFAGRAAAAAAGQAARHRPARLDDHRRRGRLPRPELPDALSHHAHSASAAFSHAETTAVPLPAKDRRMSDRRDLELAPGYRISRLIRGGWQLAGGHGAVDRERAIADMAAFVDAGITTFDCADIYTGVEELIGDFVRRRRAAGRSPLQVHTKFVPDLDDLAARRRGLRRAASSTARCSASAWSGSTSCSSTGGTTTCRASSRPRWHSTALQREGKIRHSASPTSTRRSSAAMLDAGVPLASHPGAVFAARPPARARPGRLCARHAAALLRHAWPAASSPTAGSARRAGRAAREPLARQVPAHHRGVRRLGGLPGAAARAQAHRRPARRATSPRWRRAGCSTGRASRRPSSARAMPTICRETLAVFRLRLTPRTTRCWRRSWPRTRGPRATSTPWSATTPGATAAS